MTASPPGALLAYKHLSEVVHVCEAVRKSKKHYQFTFINVLVQEVELPPHRCDLEEIKDSFHGSSTASLYVQFG